MNTAYQAALKRINLRQQKRNRYTNITHAAILREMRRNGPVWILFRSHRIEVGTGNERNRKPGYRWVQGYARVFENGSVSTCQTRRDWYADARCCGARCVFFCDEQKARSAQPQ